MVNTSISTLYKGKVTREWLVRAVTFALQSEDKDISTCGLSILVRNDDFLRKLKKKYFGINEPTDVLSFESGELDPENGVLYLGDIIISYPQAEKNALSAQKSPQSEVALLVIHGVLHLLGYDHADQHDQKIMWEKQDAILKKMD